MPTWKLEQRRLWERRTIQIYDRCVEVTQRGAFGSTSVRFPFEEIPDEPFTMTTRPKIALWAAIVPGFLTLFLLGFMLFEPQDADVAQGIWFWGLISLIASLQYAFGKKTFAGYACQSGYLLMFAERPTAADVDAFMKQIIEQRNRYLSATYAYVEPASRPADELQKLLALRDRGAISDEEFMHLKQEVLSRYTGIPAEPRPAVTGETVN